MKVRYEDTRAIALTVSQMLSLQLALSDAVRHNESHDYPTHANEYRALLAVIREQAEEWIDSAAKIVDAEMEARKAK